MRVIVHDPSLGLVEEAPLPMGAWKGELFEAVNGVVKYRDQQAVLSHAVWPLSLKGSEELHW